MPLTVGPYFEVPIGSRTAPFYALRFDKDGRTQGPRTQAHLIDALPGDFTDVYVFSHGWNNDWTTALTRYRTFFTTFRGMVEEQGLPLPSDYRPLLAGIFWPSTALVLPGERGPQFAGGGAEDEGAAGGGGAAVSDLGADDLDLSLVEAFAGHVLDSRRGRYYDLLDRDALDKEEGRELLALLSGVFAAGDPEVPGDEERDVTDLLAGWAMYEATVAPPRREGSATSFGSVGSRGRRSGEPEAAGLLDKLDPRKLLRMLTVYQMKDRAGVIGTRGVGPLLRSIQEAAPAVRVHVIGHSYGARVVLNAVSRPDGGELAGTVRSMLLLQPAVNHLCFAERLESGRPGGYRAALEKVEKPILTTFSHHDVPLHDTFHLSLRRGKDIGDIGIAADEPPSIYAALGGYGPRGLTEWAEVAIKKPGEPYDLRPDGPRVLALNGAGTILGHSEVVNEATAWALYNLVKE